ncbi:cell wall hydrolase [Ammonifex thiophilus]|uniref:LysM peptidoglycan-binding domain-containing protein n=1 Tax=Ammonifex thiophilus TaxID=444093 RepID=A0A3D8P5T3_9THEO|nr:cell wall hydrolase [Ammonifex thiophilus]RDV83204.1 LysM peptidoglycan-binding domain-containing protein [Ammonifex thiophilus]
MRRTWLGLLLVLTTAILAGAGKAAAKEIYTVAAGDTLWRISQAYGVTVEELMEENDLDSPIIFPGEVLRIPESRGLKVISSRDLELLARIIHAEARGEEFLGKVAVGAVVLNRLRHPAFPKTIPEVIFQRTNGLYEFTPVADGSINLEPDEEAYAAAREALRGRDPTGGALFFYNPRTATDRWIRTLPVTVRIGNHVFATVKN